MPTLTQPTTGRCIAETYLLCQEGSSDKGYSSQVIDHGDGTYSHLKCYGRRVGFPSTRQEPVLFRSHHTALAAHDKVVLEKTTRSKERYHIVGADALGLRPLIEGNAEYLAAAVNAPVGNALSGWAPMEFTPCSREAAESYIEDDRYVMQEKKDGIRHRLLRLNGVFECSNKSGRVVACDTDLMNQFLQLAQFCDQGDLIVDGEWADGQYFIFDLMRMDGVSGMNPFKERIVAIAGLHPYFGDKIKVVPTAFGRDKKRRLFDLVESMGREGVVIKRADAPYWDGRSAGDFKFKFKEDVTCRVQRIATDGTGAERQSLVLEVFRSDDERILAISAGKVSSGVSPTVLKEVRERLERREEVFCDVGYLYWTGTAFIQPVFLRFRDDVDAKTAVATTLRRRQEAEGAVV